MAEVDSTSYDYKMLRQLYPTMYKFYYKYVDGGYLNTDYTIYYDEDKNELYTKRHGNYS